eukprot:NODE_2655_length_2171_cov_10.424168.p1 GENE.NODE_2655_length_2171_cov_10.424168~~NODE_2655_length_2171_cov_10.424168.p1  ORF type:complete len:690 (+),score=159.17 NODE_2655_length_2171_cov_10.424168:229-2070(+)
MLEFECDDPHFEGRSREDFWLPCERQELLAALLDSIASPSPELFAKHLDGVVQQCRDAALSKHTTLIQSLKIASLLESSTAWRDKPAQKAIWVETLKIAHAPTEQIMQYFGSEIALYFAWMHFYMHWIAVPAAAGLFCYVERKLLGYTVDNDPYIPFYSLLVVFWGVCFVRYWDRECEGHAWRWGTLLAETGDAEERPDFFGEMRTNPVNGQPHRYWSSQKRLAAYGVSFMVTAVMLCLAFLIMLCLLNIEGYMTEHVTVLEQTFHFPRLAAYALPGAMFDPFQAEYWGLLIYIPVIFHVVIVSQLNFIYRHVAEWLTKRENHRFIHEHENSLILKRFLFEAFDCYIALFYVAFFQQDIVKLRRELVALFTVDCFRRIFTESIIPLFLQKWSEKKDESHRAKLKKTDEIANHAEHADIHAQLELPEYESFDDYLEMVIQFGYIVLFASAFPLAGLLSFICDLFEIKSDVFKITHVHARMPAVRTATIGIWAKMLQALVALSIVTNVCLFMISDQFAAWVPWLYREVTELDVAEGIIGHVTNVEGTRELIMKQGEGRYIIVTAAVLEHGIGLAALLLACCIPSRPGWVRDELARTEYYKDQQSRQMRRISQPHD